MRSAGRPAMTEDERRAFRDRVADHALAMYLRDGMDALSIRSLSRTVGCSPATIYAHFAGKGDILRCLWGHVLDEMSARIAAAADGAADGAQLRPAAIAFVRFWIEHPEKFRLVFMAEGVDRADVAQFVREPQTAGYFGQFQSLLARTHASDVTLRTNSLVAAMIGIALCHITIRDHSWETPEAMVDQVLAGVEG